MNTPLVTANSTIPSCCVSLDFSALQAGTPSLSIRKATPRIGLPFSSKILARMWLVRWSSILVEVRATKAKSNLGAGASRTGTGRRNSERVGRSGDRGWPSIKPGREALVFQPAACYWVLQAWDRRKKAMVLGCQPAAMQRNRRNLLKLYLRLFE